MHLSDISLKQFRSYEDAHFEFSPSLTLITGKNGSGKTNLLEAVYVLLQGGSFRVSDRDMMRSGDSWWRLDGTIDGEFRQVRYQIDHHPPKHLVIHELSKRFMAKDRLPVVLFEPNDLLLIHGSPTRRRDAIDTMLISLSSVYKTTLGKYERALKQRNNALKRQLPNLDDQLFSWDVLLSEYGVEIILARQELIQKLNERIGGYYAQIAGLQHSLNIVYKHDLGDDVTPSRYIQSLHTKLSLDKLRGTTSFGPHRDDLEFILRGVDAKQSASRGEVRSSILALKLAYTELLENVYQQKPLILLDDVFSELDETRQKNLLTLIVSNQTIITDTNVISAPNLTHIKISV